MAMGQMPMDMGMRNMMTQQQMQMYMLQQQQLQMQQQQQQALQQQQGGWPQQQQQQQQQQRWQQGGRKQSVFQRLGDQPVASTPASNGSAGPTVDVEVEQDEDTGDVLVHFEGTTIIRVRLGNLAILRRSGSR
jgi:hypothetical protein